jgi:16S rRNA (uracil1498-N3)-methyltransferase
MIRLFVPGKLQDGVTIALGGDQAHYLRDVMRRSVGDEVLLFNAEDGEWRAIVAAVDRRSVALTPRGLARAWKEGPDLELIVAVIKRARLEAVVEKAVELGVRRVRLAVTRYTQGDRVKLERLGAIAIEAAEQTGRLDVPEIVAPEKLADILDAWTDRTLIFCDEGGDALPMDATLLPLREKVASEGGRMRGQADLSTSGAGLTGDSGAAPHPSASPPPSPARGEGTSVLIGPEGGFSSEERDRLRSLPYVIPVSLGPRILRADTAAMAALVLWQSRLGDWSP